jgi:cytochrome oxidase assembly protein ShyY1
MRNVESTELCEDAGCYDDVGARFMLALLSAEPQGLQLWKAPRFGLHAVVTRYRVTWLSLIDSTFSRYQRNLGAQLLWSKVRKQMSDL